MSTQSAVSVVCFSPSHLILWTWPQYWHNAFTMYTCFHFQVVLQFAGQSGLGGNQCAFRPCGKVLYHLPLIDQLRESVHISINGHSIIEGEVFS